MKTKLILVALVAIITLGLVASFLKVQKSANNGNLNNISSTAQFEKPISMLAGAKAIYPDGLNISL